MYLPIWSSRLLSSSVWCLLMLVVLKVKRKIRSSWCVVVWYKFQQKFVSFYRFIQKYYNSNLGGFLIVSLSLVKEVDLYSAFIEVPHTQGAQVQITQCYLQTTLYLPLPRKHSPDGASPHWGCRHLIAAYYSFIYPERMKGWVGLGQLCFDTVSCLTGRRPVCKKTTPAAWPWPKRLLSWRPSDNRAKLNMDNIMKQVEGADAQTTANICCCRFGTGACPQSGGRGIVCSCEEIAGFLGNIQELQRNPEWSLE